MEKLKSLYKALDNKLLYREPVRFLIVGGIVFTMNVLFLYIFHGLLNAPLLLAQVLAAEGAITISFLLHHHWTYKGYNEKVWYRRFLHFNGSSLGGTVIANGTLLIFVHLFNLNYIFGFAVGAIFAIFWNYFANKKFIWKATKD